MPSSNKDNQTEAYNLMIEEFRQGMGDFNAAMKAREEVSLRIAKRTTQVVRFTMLGLIVLGLGMFFLIWTLTNTMGNITGYMSEVSSDMKGMRADIHQVSSNVKSISDDFTWVRKDMNMLNSSVAFMQQDISKLNKNVGGMGTNLVTIRKILAQMDKSIHHMDINITGLNESVNILSLSVGGMSGNISRMTRDINTMTAPMRAFGFSKKR